MSEVVEENKFKVDYNNIKTVDVKKSKSKFKTFTNGTAIPGTDFQPYLGKPLVINLDEILSIYPAEDDIGTKSVKYSILYINNDTC